MQPENVPARALRISITGVVQGVGFRPFVYNLARRLGVRGWVLNHSGGVDIEAEAAPETLTAFLAALRAEAPPLARIASLEATPIPSNGYTTFEIRHSEAQEGRFVLISPDVATCPDCLRELFDPADRRYRYPFINCTNCGPRFTIITDIPYDRPYTTMRVFPLCDACRAEYENPADRRFHAQPNACPECGPHLTLLAQGAATAAGALADAVERLLKGEIVAVKGLGGFQLACDATAAEAVQRLRERKHRPHKPFAVMVASLEEARLYCEISPEEAALLTSPQAPIVLLRRRTPDGAVGQASVVPEVAPNQHTLGLMLPYTPLHHLLLHDVGRPLVMTSGNLSEEPIAKDNDEALERLADIADAFLLHDRDIYARYDDSVVQVSRFANPKSGSPTPKLQIMRRARGYAPFPIPLPFEVGQVFAAGPLLKNTFTLTRERYAFVSQHIGDLENLETLEHYEAALATYQRLFRIAPERVVCDLHPDYLSTRFAEDFARAHGLPAPTRVQHHRAHLAACLADNGWPRDGGPVIGVALDGTGYGDDGAIWGGEWFLGDYDGMRRVAHLEPLPLPGGDAATRAPWRIAVAYLHALLEPEDFPADLCFAGFCPGEAGFIRQQIEKGLNVPRTTSMGRLFDAVSALLGVRSEISYEAQAAMELEQLAWGAQDWRPFPFAIEDDVVRLAPLFYALLETLERGVALPDIAARFHATVARMVLEVCVRLRDASGVTTVALSGGVFQNALLLDLTVPVLEAADFDVLVHHQVPCNDGGLSLGQAV
ncbi:MAG TPA: carbamoyltransferase HypF, partial [Anaerolineae bacterium]|nr:carbamoyltransferase HypF [Anaerolineae bacterium]